ncbi:MAG: SBBP repeat-containing protein [Ignavibacteriaceae bacterium]|nr:SBBP repeat-containing protein [Ignavibacteriaceae bacterium]
MNRILSIMFILFFSAITYCQIIVQERWVRDFNSTLPGSFNTAVKMVIDDDGNAYVTGILLLSDNTSDIITVKYDSAGVFQWSASFDGANNSDAPNDIAVDDAGNVYVTGESEAANGFSDAVTIKYTASGSQDWAAFFNGPANKEDWANSLTIDDSGNVYVAGLSMVSGFFPNYLTLKYNASGVQQWVSYYNGPANSFDEANDIAVDSDHNVYVTGGSSGGFSAGNDFATVKYNISGIQQWASRYNGTANLEDFALSLVLDNAGNLFVTGTSMNTGTVSDIVTIKYMVSNGNQEWVNVFDGPLNGQDEGKKVLLDGNGSIYVTGSVNGSVTDSTRDYVVLKINSAGALDWSAYYNGPGNKWDDALDMAIDAESNVYVTGQSYGTGTEPDYATVKYNSSGIEKWVIRYSSSGDFSDQGVSVAVTDSGDVYVSGSTNISLSTGTITTIKYNQIDISAPALPIVWEVSAANGNLPGWFSTTNNTERGIAFGFINSVNETLEPTVIVISHSNGLSLKMQDTSGAYVGEVNISGISGGEYSINDINFTSDLKIIGCNLTSDASTVPFKVYLWTSPNQAPVNVLSYTASENIRLGDRFVTLNDYGTNDFKIYTAGIYNGQIKVYIWSAASGAINPVPQIITLPVVGASGLACVAPLLTGEFYINYSGGLLSKFDAAGNLLSTINPLLLGNDNNTIKYLGSFNNSDFVAVYEFGTDNENAKILEVAGGDLNNAVVYGQTNNLGSNSSLGIGDIDFRKHSNGTADVYVFSSNNGFGSYHFMSVIPVELLSFTSSVNRNTVTLNWSTGTETNCASFAIERRDLNSRWEEIASVTGCGNSTEQKQYSFIDRNLNSGVYNYRLKTIDLNGEYTYSKIIEADVKTPSDFSLEQNYPNPFNPSTNISYRLSKESKVKLEVFNSVGEVVEVLVDGIQQPDYYTVEWQPSVASGIYLYRISAQPLNNNQPFISVKKMILIK